MPFPYTFPFKFIEFGRYLKLKPFIPSNLSITASASRGLRITGSASGGLSITPTASRGLSITGNCSEQFNITAHIKGIKR